MKANFDGLFKRYVLLFFGLLVMAFGVAFSICGDLGTSPISSVPYTLSLFTPLTVGTATICLHVTLILIQIILLRRNYQPIQLLQLPVAFIFGFMTDFACFATKNIVPGNYALRWVLCFIGIIFVAFGVCCEVTADVVMLAGEGTVTAICKVFPIPFPRAKVAFDVTLVVSAVVLSLAFTGSVKGVREGTVAAAIFVGLFSKIIKKYMRSIFL